MHQKKQTAMQNCYT